MNDNKIIIFDTTLRDGEQAPGCSLTVKEKIEIAKQLESLGVNVMEAGFPISSPGDFEAVKAIAKLMKKATICGLARCMPKDIDAAFNAVKYARHNRVHVFLATSPIHMKYKLKKTPAEVLKIAEWAVKYARKKIREVEFSAEDAGRSEKEFLYKVVETVIDAGATIVNIPDTVGYMTPYEFGKLIKDIRENVTNIDKAMISVHCHNDLGLAVANSLSAVKNGAGQVECTINGLGERAGNASLEEIVMAIATRKDYFQAVTSINTKEIYKTSRLVSKLTGVNVQPNKAIVGSNAFAHEAGIHQDGVMKKRTTYEIMKPEDIGIKGSNLVLGKHSGRHAFSSRLASLGYDLKQESIEKAFNRFKSLADKKKQVYDEDIVAIVEDEITEIPETYKLEYMHITSGTKTIPTGAVKLKYKGSIVQGASNGDGPVDACYKAIDKITKIKGKLLDYSLKAVTSGKDAVGEVTVLARFGKDVVSGRGASTDIVEASVKAYVNAINKVAFKKRKK
ncbi:MAG: 2-isopropylmalate synthase [Candidatus Omnitrophica bacterium CG07_land_8_20_14_0_80_42_15]|uniref:2-isopropylmalate synthase n=1 Tax=Candidatus Aquitaenariimonas noxiae TaxID=1974741 RepID=A0A2J0KXQ2_9BACT|nr:MAG: 2-isopropylmalate synthase [Candidatus Omnitrophica bacterium CG07_land_8_20_14_0_80_42_15]